MRRWIVLAGLLVIVAVSIMVFRNDGGSSPEPDGRSTASPDGGGTGGPNVVIVLTNDQRWDTLWAMPEVRRSLVAHGTTFENAFVVNPSCCPSRASILTGLYSHWTGVYRNHAPHGGFESFDDHSSLAVWLDAAGYETALVGEYLNGYGSDDPIPPGWDRWFALGQRNDSATKAYYDYEVNADGRIETYGEAPEDYSTDVLADEAVRFVSEAEGPFFLYFAPAAPHEPAIPPPRYADAFDDLRPWRPESYDEGGLSDKPPWLRALAARIGPDRLADVDGFRLDQYRTLLAVDDAVGRIVEALRDGGRLSDTILLFASDNGYLWGEHGMDGKGVPYEESIRIPLVMRYDDLGGRPSDAEEMALNVDLAPTIVELTGIYAPTMEGRSLVPLLTGEGRWSRRDFLIEHLGAEHIPSFCAVRTTRAKYAAYADGSEELYDLRHDPFELHNRIGVAPPRQVAAFRARLTELCDPLPPGYPGVPGSGDR